MSMAYTESAEHDAKTISPTSENFPPSLDTSSQVGASRSTPPTPGGGVVAEGSARAREATTHASPSASVKAADASSSARSRGAAAPARRRGRRSASRRRVVPIPDAREMRRCESCRRRHTLSRAHASCRNRTPPSRPRDTRMSYRACLVSPARAPTRALVPRPRDIGLGRNVFDVRAFHSLIAESRNRDQRMVSAVSADKGCFV